MDLTLIGVFAIIGLLLFLLLGTYIAIDFLFIGLIGTAIILGIKPALQLLGQTMYYSIATPNFAALPLFVLMGAFAARGGFAKKAYEGVQGMTAGLPGSLAIATCFGCAAFGAISGSSLATAAIFGKLALPEMERYKYNKKLALGSIAAAGTFAAMIPPSGGFIVYAIFTGQSVGRLFMAGIVPGIITAIVYSLSIMIRVKRNPKLAPTEGEEKTSFKERISSVSKIWTIAILALIVLGGIYSGLFTPTEAAAAGAFATLLLGVQQGKIRKFSIIKEALRESAATTSMIFLIIISALFFSRFLAITQIPNKLSMMVQSLDCPRIFIMLAILFIWFILGMIIIPTGIFALTLPIVFPIIVNLGYDPIWFGVIALKLSEIAAVTPPVGLNVYALKGVAGKGTTIEDVFSGIWPFVICDIIVLILLLMFPEITLWLPNMMAK
jgi:C4-dicarboxylate transporter, DctM subunit